MYPFTNKRQFMKGGFLSLTQQEAQVGIPELVWRLSSALRLVPSQRFKARWLQQVQLLGISSVVGLGVAGLLTWGFQRECPKRNRHTCLVSSVGASAVFCSLRHSRCLPRFKGGSMCSVNGRSGGGFKTPLW